MPRWIKISLKTFGILLSVILIAWIGIAAYIHSNKKELLDSITAQLNENLNGTLTIEKMEPALISGFPGISVTLTNILLRDSLWARHKHDVIKANEAFVSVDAFSILKGDPTIKNITINDGNLYFYTDSSGYSNTDIFKKPSANESQEKSANKKINKVVLRNVNLVIDDVPKTNYFAFDINRFSGNLNYNASGWKGKVNVDALVKTLAFNTRLGSFIKDKVIKTNLDISFDDGTKEFSVPNQKINIGGNDFDIGAKFAFAETNSDYALDIKIPEISFQDARELFSPNISSRLKYYELKKPLSAEASIRGKLKLKQDPKISASWIVEDNTLIADGEIITDCSFNGSYNNESVKDGGFKDANSVIALYNMKGRWHAIPFTADSITISNLKKPVLAGNFKSNFPLVKLNSIFGNQTFSFSKGTALLNLRYKAPYLTRDQSQRYIYGNVQISDASLNYLARDLQFNNVKARLDFRGQDLYLLNTNVQSGGSSLQMTGSIKSFLNFYYNDPKKMLIDWDIKSPQINLSQFLSFLGRRKASAAAPNMNKISSQIDRVLNEAHVHIKMKVNRVSYKKFLARNVNAELSLGQQGIGIDNVSLSHAGGSLNIQGNIDQTDAINKVRLKTRIKNANIQELFFGFNNFGQDAIIAQNLSGIFSANCDVTGSLKDNGDVVPRSIKGTVSFNLKNGALINFEPLEKIGSFAFANRDFSNITFKNLSNTLTLKGNSVLIPPMQIESSVLNIFLEGIYGFSSGTNIAMQVPLRNPKKDEFVVDKDEKERRSRRGIVINVRAVDGEDGKVKFKLGKD